MGVGAQGEAGVVVTKILGHRPDADAVVEEDRGVVVCQGVHPVPVHLGAKEPVLPDVVRVVGTSEEIAAVSTISRRA